jgi:hypothetical protein
MEQLERFFNNDNIELTDRYESEEFLHHLRDFILESSLGDTELDHFIISTIYNLCGISYREEINIETAEIPRCYVNFKLEITAYFYQHGGSQFSRLIDDIDYNLVNTYSNSF